MKILAVSLALIGLAPAAALALDVSGLSIALNSGNSADLTTNTGNNREQLASTTSVTLAPAGPIPDVYGQTITFATRYASLLAVDREGPAAGTTSNTLISDYRISFTIVNPSNADYQVEIDTRRVGALTAVTDDPGSSTQTLGAVTGMVDSIVNGSFALLAVGPLATSASALTTFSQNGSTVTIFDNAPSRTYVLDFSWTSTATSDNDEAAIRMGVAGSLTTTLADDYPGSGGRTVGNDGHFVDVTVTMLPEPNTGAMLALGLVGIGVRRRAVRRSRAARAA